MQAECPDRDQRPCFLVRHALSPLFSGSEFSSAVYTPTRSLAVGPCDPRVVQLYGTYRYIIQGVVATYQPPPARILVSSTWFLVLGWLSTQNYLDPGSGRENPSDMAWRRRMPWCFYPRNGIIQPAILLYRGIPPPRVFATPGCWYWVGWYLTMLGCGSYYVKRTTYSPVSHRKPKSRGSCLHRDSGMSARVSIVEIARFRNSAHTSWAHINCMV